MRHFIGLILLLTLTISSATAQRTFFEETVEHTYKEGFFDLYVNEKTGSVMAGLPAPQDDGTVLRFIYTTGLTAGLGSNPIGLDRGSASGGVIVRFRQIGNKIIAEQENWRYRATAGRDSETKAVLQSFAPSFLWSTDIKATSIDGRLLIDLSKFLTRDQNDIARDLKHGPNAGAYKLAADRSFPDAKATFAFPDNVELDAFLTFDSSSPNGQTRATAADGRSVTLVLHHSFVRLPDDGYTPRAFDQRTANIGMGYYDYSADLGDPIVTRLSRRFRLEREDPNAASGPVKKPIIFYVDNGAPEEIRNALIEGASWWAEGFEAAGFEDGYRVEILPEDAHPLDVRYNVINWVHRQTRGWSYGGSVSDPRTGEILKANVILGSQRVRQDRMIFEGLAGARKTGTGASDDPIQVSLARIRQLSAHEVGHTLGFAHNFAASSNDRASVMDYPAPFVRYLYETDQANDRYDERLDFSQAYDVGLGAWDVFTVKWLYSQYPEGVDETKPLNQMVTDAFGSGLRFISDQHARLVGTAHPYASVWDNGEDAIETLKDTLDVRAFALRRFGLTALQDGRASSDLNAVIVPIYLYHRYQVAAAVKYIGGLDFSYGVTGQIPLPGKPVDSKDQKRALDALIVTLDPRVLDLSDRTLNLLTPGDTGFAGAVGAAETFPGRSGPVFDLLAASDTAANLTLSAIFHPDRAARLVEYGRRYEDALTLQDTINEVEKAVFSRTTRDRHRAIARTVQSRFVQTLIELSRSGRANGQIASIVDGELAQMRADLKRRGSSRYPQQRVHFTSLIRMIDRHLAGEPLEFQAKSAPATPPGSPIGSGEDCWHCEL
ncbi:MAG: zinc-dependent metalloprotease [Pseudomonadota bacterium]